MNMHENLLMVDSPLTILWPSLGVHPRWMDHGIWFAIFATNWRAIKKRKKGSFQQVLRYTPMHRRILGITQTYHRWIHSDTNFMPMAARFGIILFRAFSRLLEKVWEKLDKNHGKTRYLKITVSKFKMKKVTTILSSRNTGQVWKGLITP